MKSQIIVAPFSGHTGAVTALAFSENGYYLATTSEDNLVRLWDLRKLTNFKVLTLPEDNKLNKVVWDHTGQYLAVGGTDVRYVWFTLYTIHLQQEWIFTSIHTISILRKQSIPFQDLGRTRSSYR